MTDTKRTLTVLFHKNNLFESAAAALTDAFPIPIIDVADYDTVIDMIEYVTDAVIIMGSFLSIEQLRKLVSKGFKEVIAFGEYTFSKDTDEDKKIFTFDIDNIYVAMDVNVNGLSLIILECAIATTFPDYKIEMTTKSHAAAFRCGLESYNKDFYDQIREMSSSIKGFEAFEKIVARGAAIVDIRREIINERMKYVKSFELVMNNVGSADQSTETPSSDSVDTTDTPSSDSVDTTDTPTKYIVSAIHATELIKETARNICLHKTKTNETVDVGIVYRFEPRIVKSSEDKPGDLKSGYFLNLITKKGTDARKILEQLIGIENLDEPVALTFATGWAPVETVHKFMQFL